MIRLLARSANAIINLAMQPGPATKYVHGLKVTIVQVKNSHPWAEIEVVLVYEIYRLRYFVDLAFPTMLRVKVMTSTHD